MKLTLILLMLVTLRVSANEEKRTIEFVINEIEPLHKVKQLYSDLLGFKESGNRSNITNTIRFKTKQGKDTLTHAIGKYQFTMRTLKHLGYTFTYDQFIANPSVFPLKEQEKALKKFTSINKKILKRYIKEYSGKIVKGVKITEAGLIGAAHLGGAGSVINFFNSNHIAKDQYKTTIVYYMNIFSNTQI
jgi:hypothetical protein